MQIEIDDLPEGYVLLESIVLMKVLNKDGEIRWREGYSKNLNLMERLGMLESAADTIRGQLRDTTRPG